MNVILCGYHWSGCKALELLRGMGHNVYVYTHENPYHIPSLSALCRKYGVPFSIDNISNVQLPFVPDVICSIYYRFMIKRPVIDACRRRIFNLHPSLLPKYRGCSSVTWAIINGEQETGYTYHYIDEGCDTGDIILQERISIEKYDTQETLYTRVMFEAMQRFPEAFSRASVGQPGTKQEGEASQYARGCPYNGQIDPAWSQALKERFIRAMVYPPYPVARRGDKEIHSLRDLEE